MEVQQRISQFEKMAADDTENEMAHFSLGSAYLQAGRPAEAAKSLLRCVELAPGMSKAYQLAAEALVAAGDREAAAEVATKGYVVADGRGDRMPREAMGEILRGLGKPTPTPAAQGAGPAAAAGPAGGGGFICRRTGRAGTKLARPPFKGPVGAWICENIAQETWNAWIGQGTKVINELRLDLSREEDGATYDQYMREYLGIDEELYQQLISA